MIALEVRMFWNSITVPLISNHVNHSTIPSSLLSAAHGTAGPRPYQLLGKVAVQTMNKGL